MTNIGFVICTRLNSRRAPHKALTEINGRPLLAHLIDRLRQTNLPIILAIPNAEYPDYAKFWQEMGYDSLIGPADAHIQLGYDDDPMRRMFSAAKRFGFDHVIRVTHDKLFVDHKDVFAAIEAYFKTGSEYLYSSTMTSGTGFEIISSATLEKACSCYKNVEHISYAVKAIAQKVHNLDLSHKFQKDVRLLIDYPEDFTLLNLIMAVHGNDCTQKQAVDFCRDYRWVRKINRLPELTVYTCGYHAAEWIEKCMGSVAEQEGFGDFEYILVDDHSKDQTAYLMAKFSTLYGNVKFIRNGRNLGLASSSNVALSHARGKFMIRLDADDYFTSTTAVKELLYTIQAMDADAIYPANYFGTRSRVQRPEECHHVGGAIFRTRAVNHIKFTDGLRGLEGYDFFERARSQLKIGYLQKPLFFYTQHGKSLTHGDPRERELIRQDIENRIKRTRIAQEGTLHA